MDRLSKFFDGIKKTSLPDPTKKSPESRALSEEIAKLKDIISTNYDQDTFKEECKKCLTHRSCNANFETTEVPPEAKLEDQKQENNAKFRLANFALDLESDLLTDQADIVWCVLDEHFSKTGLFFKQYYSDMSGMKELADQEDCGVAAYLYAMKLRDNAESSPDTKEKEKIKQEADVYLLKAVDCGCAMAFGHFCEKNTAQTVGADLSSPLRANCKRIVQPENYINQAQEFFAINDVINARRTLQWAATLKKTTIVGIGKEFATQKNIAKALLCYEVASLYGDKEAKFLYMKLKADQGDVEQQFQLAYAYLTAKKEDLYPAFNNAEGQKYLRLTMKSHAGANLFMAEWYCNGYLVAKAKEAQAKPEYISSHKLSATPANLKGKPYDEVIQYLNAAKQKGNLEAIQIFEKLKTQFNNNPIKIFEAWLAYRKELKEQQALKENQKPNITNIDQIVVTAVTNTNTSLPQLPPRKSSKIIISTEVPLSRSTSNAELDQVEPASTLPEQKTSNTVQQPKESSGFTNALDEIDTPLELSPQTTATKSPRAVNNDQQNNINADTNHATEEIHTPSEPSTTQQQEGHKDEVVPSIIPIVTNQSHTNLVDCEERQELEEPKEILTPPINQSVEEAAVINTPSPQLSPRKSIDNIVIPTEVSSSPLIPNNEHNDVKPVLTLSEPSPLNNVQKLESQDQQENTFEQTEASIELFQQIATTELPGIDHSAQRDKTDVDAEQANKEVLTLPETSSIQPRERQENDSESTIISIAAITTAQDQTKITYQEEIKELPESEESQQVQIDQSVAVTAVTNTPSPQLSPIKPTENSVTPTEVPRSPFTSKTKFDHVEPVLTSPKQSPLKVEQQLKAADNQVDLLEQTEEHVEFSQHATRMEQPNITNNQQDETNVADVITEQVNKEISTSSAIPTVLSLEEREDIPELPTTPIVTPQKQTNRTNSDVEQGERRDTKLNLPPKLDNLFVENSAPMTKTGVKPTAQLNDNRNSPRTSEPTVQQSTISKGDDVKQIGIQKQVKEKGIEKDSDESSSSTTFVLLALALVVPISAVMAYKYYQRNS